MKTIITSVTGLLYAALAFAQVPYQRIANAEGEPGNWLTYSGSYHSTRFSPLGQINTGNVAKLAPVWIYQLHGGGNNPFECTPIVVDKIMYRTPYPVL